MSKPSRPKVNLIPCDSSNVMSIGYDAATQTLEVRFHTGRVFHYHKVPPEHFDALRWAESVGKYLNHHIKHRFDYTRIDEED